jgi:hypothetical protein
MLSDEELVVDSRVILTGRVRSYESAWDEAGSTIWTYVTVEVERVLKGNLDSKVVVLKQMGGEVGLVGMEVFGQPQFEPGGEVLLFLNTASDGTLHTAHCFMGMFKVFRDASGQKTLRRAVTDSVNLVARIDNEIVTDIADYQEYINRVEGTLQREYSRIEQREAERIHQPLVAIPPEMLSPRRRTGGYAPAFTLMSGGVRWFQPDSGIPIDFKYNPANSPVGGGGAAELTRAMNAWPQQSGAKIQLRLTGQTSACGLVADNTNVISYADCRNELDPPSNCSGVVALTRVAYYSDTRVINGVAYKRMAEADIVFNRGMDCFLRTSANLAEIACHELGHAIGLGHSNDSSAIMYSSARGRGRDATLGQDDKQGALSIYPSGQAGQPSGPLQLSRVKVKSHKKVVVYGENFSRASVAYLNGSPMSPKSLTSSRFVLKGSLDLRPEGGNTLYVRDGSQRTSTLIF